MRLKTPVNKEEFKTHITYNAWKYILLVIGAFAVWSFVADMKPSIPEDKKIEVYVMSATTDSEIIDPFLEPLWQKTVPEMESVYSIMIPAMDEYTMAQYFVTRMYAKEGDIYILTEEYFKEYAKQGFFLPLEELTENGTIDAEGVDLQNGYVTRVIYNSDNEVVATESHLYGIPLESFDAYQTKISLYNINLYAGIMVLNQNDDNVIPFFNALLQEGRTDSAQTAEEAKP